ncbi:MAG: FAD-binding oxidoreductase [Dehalococcoidia bacterium]
MTNIDALYKELLPIFGEERISIDEAVLQSYASDTATAPGAAVAPPIVVLPQDVEEVRQALMVCNKNKQPVICMSRGSNGSGLAVPYRGEVMFDLRLMNKIIEINEDAAYAIIEPGVTFDELSYAARKHNFNIQLPTATGGGSPLANYLMRPPGNLAAKWDPDPVLGIEFVTPTGEVVRTGSAAFGEKPISWRNRYGPFPDLTGLFGCSYGIFGIVTKAAVKLFDKGETTRVVFTKWDSFPPVLDYMKRIVRRNVADSCTFWNWVWNYFHELMYSKSPAMTNDVLESVMRQDQKNPPPGMPFGINSARLSGYKEVVDAQEKVCMELAEELGGQYMSHDEMKEKLPGSFDYLNQYFGDSIHIKPGEETTLRIIMWLSGLLVTVEPKQMLELEKFMWKFAEENAKPPHMFRVLPFREGREFIITFVILIKESLEKEKDYMLKLRSEYAELYKKLLEENGAIQFRFRGDPSYFALTGQYGKLMKRIKDSIDPNGIMHPSINMFE